MAYIKMAIYGEPGVGKSTFAAGAPKPFFITTDGNYEYLESFCGSNAEDHVQISSWKEFKNVVETYNFSEYETIVVDLVEDTYLWATNEFCKENKITHLSDLGYGKGYEIIGQEYFITFAKLISMQKNIILVFHGVSETLKDRRGIEYTKYKPSGSIREKIVKQIEGRLRFFLRAYAEVKENNQGKFRVERYLSLSPDGQTEYGVARGLSSDAPESIPLSWDTFVSVTGLDITTHEEKREVAPKAAPKKIEQTITKTIPKKLPTVKKEEPEEPIEDEIAAKLKEILNKKAPVSKVDTSAETKEVIEEKEADEEHPVEAAVNEQKEAPVASTLSTGVSSNEDKFAAIKAKMAALKASRG